VYDLKEPQLALIGTVAGDDPEGEELFGYVDEESAKDPDLFVLRNLGGVASMEVNVSKFNRGVTV